MDDLDILARDFGFGPGGNSEPMRSAKFSDVFGEPAKFVPNANQSSMRDIDYVSMFNSEAKSVNGGKTAPVPVYDEPVYDDDIFKGLPGLKSESTTSAARYDNGGYAGISSAPLSKGGNQSNFFKDLLENSGRREQAKEKIGSSAKSKSDSSSKGYDDLLAGFGSGVSAASNR